VHVAVGRASWGHVQQRRGAALPAFERGQRLVRLVVAHEEVRLGEEHVAHGGATAWGESLSERSVDAVELSTERVFEVGVGKLDYFQREWENRSRGRHQG